MFENAEQRDLQRDLGAADARVGSGKYPDFSKQRGRSEGKHVQQRTENDCAG
jgi:hypothetical protein